MPTKPQPLEARKEAIVSLSAGLDALETTAAPQKSRRNRVLKSLAPLAAIAFVLIVWQGAVALQLAPVWVLPTPEMVWKALVDQASQGILFESAFNSLRKGVQGFVISLLIATPLGIALGLNSALRAIARPLIKIGRAHV